MNENLQHYLEDAREEIDNFCNDNEHKELTIFDIDKSKEYKDNSNEIVLTIKFE